MRKLVVTLVACVALLGAAQAGSQSSVDARAHAQAARQGVTGSSWRCLATLITRENGHPPSSWNPTQYNSHGSGAYGLPQALPGEKMASAGGDWRTNPATQVRWMIWYANERYGGACSALAF